MRGLGLKFQGILELFLYYVSKLLSTKFIFFSLSLFACSCFFFYLFLAHGLTEIIFEESNDR